MGSLERAGLVRSTRVGKYTHYRRNAADVDDLLHRLEDTL
jgi:DNA-binding transcriptional ArsR family regulator